MFDDLVDMVKENRDTHFFGSIVEIGGDYSSLEKGRVKYLEHYFYKKVCDCVRYIVKNGNTPTKSPVRREVRDNLMTAVENIKLIMPTLGYKVCEPSKSADPSPKIMLHLAGKKARAE